MITGTGTAVNVATVLLGATVGVLAGHRLPPRSRDLVTDALGLVTLLIAGLSVVSVNDPALAAEVGSSAPLLIVLGSLVLGGIVGSLLRLEQRVEALGGWLQARLSRSADSTGRARFIEGFVTSSLVFCTGPLTILGSLSDGLGHGADQLYLKATLDGFAAIAFAASFGWGVAASALTVLAVQGSLTLLGAGLGNVLSDAGLAAVTASGGLMLVGVALRLLRIREIAVADLLPGLVVAPLLVQVVAAFR
ncbi:DUF554 domain-containing protein [Nocardioides cynanchi]|uniref:DUF554 domain-containing protein n=1 Tax=Nocardioides cynanchi TaxID=2558918 RepID=UPI00192E149F|nr:DUF554 domain-containing protein [Nocardioides cynanchi]